MGIKWGDHVDHVYVDPTRTQVLSWSNGVWLNGSELAQPVPLDHSPLIVNVRVN